MGWGVCGTRALQQTFRQKIKKERHHRETFWNIFSYILLKYILDSKFNPKINTIRTFLSKIKTLFQFQKGQGRPFLPCLVQSLWVLLNTHQYPWICLNIFENTWVNCSDFASALNMHDHLACLTDFWWCLGF